MGQEVSWYLRFSRGKAVEVLAQTGSLGQIKNAQHLEPQWGLDIQEDDGFIRARFTRKHVRK